MYMCIQIVQSNAFSEVRQIYVYARETKKKKKKERADYRQ